MPNHPRTEPYTIRRSKELRRNMTPEERRLWGRLRNDQLGVSFRRQHAIGPFITDFCCIKRKLVVELDGGQHQEQEEYDRTRTAYLESRGYRVIRFWNSDVEKNLGMVLGEICKWLPED